MFAADHPGGPGFVRADGGRTKRGAYTWPRRSAALPWGTARGRARLRPGRRGENHERGVHMAATKRGPPVGGDVGRRALKTSIWFHFRVCGNFDLVPLPRFRPWWWGEPPSEPLLSVPSPYAWGGACWEHGQLARARRGHGQAARAPRGGRGGGRRARMTARLFRFPSARARQDAAPPIAGGTPAPPVERQDSANRCRLLRLSFLEKV